MNCKQVKKSLTGYINGDIEKGLKENIDLHLYNCGDCAELLRQVQSTLAISTRRKKLEPNPFLYTRIMEQFKDAEKDKISSGKPFYIRVLQPALIGILLLAAVFTGVNIGNTLLETGTENISARDTDYYLNDMQQESLEIILLSD